MPGPWQSAILEAARERRSITLDQLLNAASHSVVDPAIVSDLASEVGLEVSQGEGLGRSRKLARQGQAAFTPDREEFDRPQEEILADPATLYLREISHVPCGTPGRSPIEPSMIKSSAHATRAI